MIGGMSLASQIAAELAALVPRALARALGLFTFALAFAAVEIEIEGADGWAERLPTWYRVTPLYARVFGWVMSGKPLTGYHAVMFFIPLLSFHLGFLFGLPWTGAREAEVIAAYLVWNVVWDFLWFVLNPRYTWTRFRKGEIWWHGRRWIGRFPIDYWNAFALSLLVAALPAWPRGDARVLAGQLALLAGLLLLSGLAVAFAPRYVRWYRHMRRPGADERHLAVPRHHDEAVAAAELPPR
jgi:hypothetical protein